MAKADCLTSNELQFRGLRAESNPQQILQVLTDKTRSLLKHWCYKSHEPMDRL